MADIEMELSQKDTKKRNKKEERVNLKKAAYKSQKESDHTTLTEVLELIKKDVKPKKQRHLREAAKQFSQPSLRRVLDFHAKEDKDIADIIKQEIVVTGEHDTLFIKRLRDVQSLDLPSEYDLLLPHAVLVHNLKTLQSHFLSWNFIIAVLSCPLDSEDLIKYIILNQLSTTLIGYETTQNVLYFSIVLILPLIMLTLLIFGIIKNMSEDTEILNEQYTEARLALKSLILIRLLLLILITSVISMIFDVLSKEIGGIFNLTTLSTIIVGIVVFMVSHETSKNLLAFKKSDSLFWIVPLTVFFVTNLIVTILSLIPQCFILSDREIVNQDHKCPQDFPSIIGALICGFFRMWKSLFQTFIGVLSILGIPIGSMCCQCCGKDNGKTENFAQTREIMLEECKVVVPDNVQMRQMDKYRRENSNISKITEADVKRVNEGWGDVNAIYKHQSAPNPTTTSTTTTTVADLSGGERNAINDIAQNLEAGAFTVNNPSVKPTSSGTNV